MATTSQSSSSATPLTNSTTFIPKATYVPLKVDGVTNIGAATQKFAFLRSLNLQPGEVDMVLQAMSVTLAPSDNSNLNAESLSALLKSFEGTPLPAQLPKMAAFAEVPVDQLVSFGNALASVRARSVSGKEDGAAGSAINLLNTALVASRALANSAALPSIGMLNLERLEMTPAGVERGGLLATIPLAPQERTSVVQQEWSVTSQEFTSIVTDSLENYSETGVTENTQMTQATTSQVSHSNQFNVSASASGGIGFVSGSVSTSFGSQDQNSQSSNDSRTHALQTTQKASSRVTQSHKTSISISTTTGTSEASTRVLYNPSTTDAIRVDYFSLMRRWYVALYRYGLRLTYDITVPEPGAALREPFRDLAVLQERAAADFTLKLNYSDITVSNYQDLGSQYGTTLPAPPDASIRQNFSVQNNGTFTGSDPNQNTWIFSAAAQISAPDGYKVERVILNLEAGVNHPTVNSYGTLWISGFDGYPFGQPYFMIDPAQAYGLWTFSGPLLNRDGTNFLAGTSGSATALCLTQGVNPAFVTFDATFVPTDANMEQWQTSVYSAIYNAAQTAYYSEQQNVSGQIAALQQKIQSVDTLTLRREENDEIMKCVLRWLLGSQVDVFMPDNVTALFKNQPGADLQHGIDFTGSDTTLQSGDWTTVQQYEDMVNFVNQAVDWDNIIYFLYSYFWDVPESWDFIRQIQHPDATRQAFLRSGSARVVLTIRQGWERAWTYFVLTGNVPSTNDPVYGHPYMTIAQQIEDYDSTNYPGIPPADSSNTGPVDYGDIPQVGTTCSETIEPSSTPVALTVADTTGFIVGANAIIDSFNPDPAKNVQETQIIKAVDTTTNQITVAALTYQHPKPDTPGEPVSFPVVQAGSKGLLIAEWFEYTPTSGTDIVVNSDLTTIE
jgi:hypothetical protein